MFLDSIGITVKKQSFEAEFLESYGFKSFDNCYLNNYLQKRLYFKNFICELTFSIFSNKEIDLKTTYKEPTLFIPETVHAVNLEKEETLTFKIDLQKIKEVEIHISTETDFVEEKSFYQYFFNNSLLEIVLDTENKDLKKEFRPILPLVIK